MLKLYCRVKGFFTSKKEEGASMAEYALLLFLITVALFVVIGNFSGAIQKVFEDTTDKFTTQPTQ